VLSRARSRDRAHALPPEGHLSRLLHLLRLSRVLRGLVRRADARPAAADGAIVRGAVLGARARRDRLARGLLLPGSRRLRLPVSLRGPELLRDPVEPDPAARARRVLDPHRPDPGARPPASRPGLRPGRPVAQAPDPRAVQLAGGRTAPVRDRRVGLHDLLVLHGVLLLATHLRRDRERALARGSGLTPPAPRPRAVLRRAGDPRRDRAHPGADEARPLVRGARALPQPAGLAHRGGRDDRSLTRLRGPPRR